MELVFALMTYRIGANRSPGPVFFMASICCGGLYSRRASIQDRALFFHRFSTGFKALILVCVSKNASMHLQLNQEKGSDNYARCKTK